MPSKPTSKKRLTKSRFKIGSECPTKLYYNDRKEYGNKKNHDEFLRALAEGGFQVGELAKLYYPGGTEIDTLDYEESMAQTHELLKMENAIIYEAALGYENLFVRVDILVKKGSEIELIEVKAKSFDSTENFEPFDKRALKVGKYYLKADYGTYLLDIAFQTLVARKALPKFRIYPFLMMADKSRVATVDGLNQLFLIQKNADGRVSAIVKDPMAKLGKAILERLDMGEIVDRIFDSAQVEYAESFGDLVEKLGRVMENPERTLTAVGSQCKGCEFRISKNERSSKMKSGFEECWAQAKNLKLEDFEKELVFDVWDFRSSDKALEQDKIFGADLDESDLKMKEREDDKAGLSRTERQLKQIEFSKSGIKKPFFDAKELSRELKSFKFPMHFIDFETNMVAIPFHSGRRPYEQMAFQFSHHIVYEDGRMEHKTEYLDERLGVFPNFDFVRALKKALSGDSGVVFRFAAHENTVLNQIRTQLLESSEADRDELLSWIESMTTPPSCDKDAWKPKRQFIDMRDLTLRYYYLPETKGSNSIKKILPAVLNTASSRVLDQFQEWIIRDEQGRVKDPYKLLPPIFSDIDPAELAKVEQWLVDREELNDGGAAMIAWARMQFTEMSDVERKALREALLRYCKLDTLAMVMIYKWWLDEISKSLTKESAA